MSDSAGQKAEAPTGEVPAIRAMLERLLADVEAELEAATSERMKSYHSGAKVALLAALNFQPLLRATPTGGGEPQ